MEDSEKVISASHKKPDGDDKDLDISEHVYTESRVPKNEQDVSDVHLESSSSSEGLKHEGPNCKEQQVHSSLELDRFGIKLCPSLYKGKKFFILGSLHDYVLNILNYN